jgi:hypothetical protein
MTLKRSCRNVAVLVMRWIVFDSYFFRNEGIANENPNP